ncbi:PAS domain S-box protein [candidate division WOR-3 bacterium]|nr:PAS domain S-box protein [candidate division WOR-3 bacterium]
MEKKKVLIVEDQNLISLRIKLVLEQNSFDIVGVVDSAEEALEILERTKPDAIILDIVLSGKMDGITASDIIRKKFGIPIIFLTALKDREQLSELARDQHYAVIYKPIQENEITQNLEKVLSRNRQKPSVREKTEFSENHEIFIKEIIDEKSFDFVNCLILVLDKNGRLVKMNSRAEQVLQTASREVEGLNFDSVFSLKSLKSGKNPADILKSFLKDGDVEMFSSFTELNFEERAFGILKMSYAVKNPLGGFTCFILAINEKHPEDTMDNFYRISSERIKTIINNIGEGIGVVSGDEVFIFSNPTADKIFGVYPETLIGKGLKNFLSLEQYQTVLSETEKRKSLNKTTYLLEISRPDGEKRILSVTATPETDENGYFIGSIGIFEDITEKIKKEKILIEEQEKLKHLINGSKDIVYSIDTLGNIVFIGPQTKTYNLTPDDVIGKNILEFIHPDDREKAMSDYAKVLQTGQSFPSEVRLVDMQGVTHWFEDYGNPYFDREGNIIGQIGMLRDITERKRMDDELKSALKEKEILLREIHHRVRNNLEVISSLLQLQSSYVGDEKLSILLKETQSRVMSIGHVHGLLYHSENYSTIEFSNFIDTLTEEIFQTFKKTINHIEIIKDLQKISLSIDKAIPAGLIVNELMINSLRHAFVGRKEGALLISLQQDQTSDTYGARKKTSQV